MQKNRYILINELEKQLADKIGTVNYYRRQINQYELDIISLKEAIAEFKGIEDVQP